MSFIVRVLLNNIMRTMDIFDSPYYSINKKLHCFVGTWPFQKRWDKYVRRLIVFILNISATIPETLKIIQFRYNVKVLIDTLPMLFTHILHIAEYTVYIFCGAKMTELLNKIEYNWNTLVSDKERAIMYKYAEFGRKTSKIAIGTYIICVVLYVSIPLVPRVLDIWRPLNESRPYIYIFDGDYKINQDEYFIYIYIHHIMLQIMGMSSIIATDTLYGIYAQHACGLFAIVKYELEHLSFSENRSQYNESQNFESVINTIKKHEKALRFCDLFESAHVFLMFIIIVTSVLSLTMTGLQIFVYLDKPLKALQFVMLYIGHLMHIFFYCWNSQEIVDHSSFIYEAAYNGKWYDDLNRTAKLVLFLMLCSKHPFVLTAGKLFPLTLENFAVILKTSVSYFTVLANFQ